MDKVESVHLPTPSTRDSGRSSIPPIPLLPLPKIPVASGAGNLFSLSTPASEPGLTSSPKKPSLLSDPFEIKEKKTTPTGTPEERKQALFARVSVSALIV